LIIVTSDHGESLGEHGLFLHANSLYRNEIQVPLILSWRGRIPAGTRIKEPVTNSALAATVMDLIGADDHPWFPGPSLAQFWKTPPSRDWSYPIAEVEQIPWQPKTAPASQGKIRSLVGVPWQYVEHEKWGVEVYDWLHDPGALHNLARQPAMQPEIARFRRALDQRLRRNPSEVKKASSGDGPNKSGAPSGGSHALAVSRSFQGQPRHRWVSWFSWLH
jgi:arylsulfatase A-like enzyme